jgi:hypothetical protein
VFGFAADASGVAILSASLARQHARITLFGALLLGAISLTLLVLAHFHLFGFVSLVMGLSLLAWWRWGKPYVWLPASVWLMLGLNGLGRFVVHQSPHLEALLTFGIVVVTTIVLVKIVNQSRPKPPV